MPRDRPTGGSGDGDDSPPPPRGLFSNWAGWQARVAADPSFPYKVLLEQVIGVGAAVIGDMSSRPHWGLYELDFVFSTLVVSRAWCVWLRERVRGGGGEGVCAFLCRCLFPTPTTSHPTHPHQVGSILNFALMYLLAPTLAPAAAAAAAAKSAPSLASRIISGDWLASRGAPRGHAFEPGFPLPARLLNAAVKGTLFAAVGFGAGVIGTATSNGLLALRLRADPSFALPNAPPSVLANAGTWAAHMGVSSNLRYQALNGLDAALAPVLPAGVFRAWSVAVRTANNVAGGVSFVLLARALGVQQAAAAPETKDGKGKKKK